MKSKENDEYQMKHIHMPMHERFIVFIILIKAENTKYFSN